MPFRNPLAGVLGRHLFDASLFFGDLRHEQPISSPQPSDREPSKALTAITIVAVLIASIVGQRADGQTIPEKSPQNEIDASTVAAYNKIGGTYQVSGLPCFRFIVFPKAKLPDVAVPFGLWLDGSDVTDQGLIELVSLKNLSELMLNFTKVTNTGLTELGKLKSLRSLGLYLTQVTDTGLKEMAGLKNLQKLSLGKTKVTDMGLKELSGLKNLQDLDLFGMK